jgi:hypothetical protein
MRPAKDCAGRQIRRLGGNSGCWVSWKDRKEWTGSDKEGLCAFNQMQGWKPPKKKRGRILAPKLGSPRGGPQAYVGAGDVWFWDIWTEGMVEDIANAVFREGMRLQGERDVRICETPFPFFLCPLGDINSRLR